MKLKKIKGFNMLLKNKINLLFISSFLSSCYIPVNFNDKPVSDPISSMINMPDSFIFDEQLFTKMANQENKNNYIQYISENKDIINLDYQQHLSYVVLNFHWISPPHNTKKSQKFFNNIAKTRIKHNGTKEYNYTKNRKYQKNQYTQKVSDNKIITITFNYFPEEEPLKTEVMVRNKNMEILELQKCGMLNIRYIPNIEQLNNKNEVWQYLQKKSDYAMKNPHPFYCKE